MFYDIEKIVRSDDDINKKIEDLDFLNRNFQESIKDIKKSLLKGHKYCSECHKYYLESDWEVEYKVEKRRVCTYWPLGDLDDAEYERKDCHIKYERCPNHHEFNTNLDYTF